MIHVEVFYISNGLEIVDTYDFPDGTYVNARILADGRGYVRTMELYVECRDVVRIKIIGPYRGPNGNQQLPPAQEN